MQHFLFSSSLGGQSVAVSDASKEKLRMQNITETLCPRFCEGKLILQEIIQSLTPGRHCKQMTQALAERAVEVTSCISPLLDGAEEIPQLRCNMFQLEQTLRDINLFVQSETQQNMLFRILFAKGLHLRNLSLEKRLIELLKQFEESAKKAPILGVESLSATNLETHPGVSGARDEIVAPNNVSNVHTSGSIFPYAINPVVHNGTFYAAGHDVIITHQDYNQTPKGIVKGVDVFTVWDVVPHQEIYEGRGYRIYSAHSTAKARSVKIKQYEGTRAKERCIAAAKFSQRVMHPNVLHLIGVSPLDAELAFLVFNNDTEWAVESLIASTLSKGLEQSVYLGLQTVAGISSGLNYLRIHRFPFASVGLDHFAVARRRNGNILVSFDLEIFPDETHEQAENSSAAGVSGGDDLDVFHGLCQKTFNAARRAHYESQEIRHTYIDEFDADHDLDQNRSEEFEFDLGTLPVETNSSPQSNSSGLNSFRKIFRSVPSNPPTPVASKTASKISSSGIPPTKSTPSAPRWELVWKSQEHEMVSLGDIAHQFQDFLLTSSTSSALSRRRGRYTTKTAHRCPGYNRIEITLTSDIARSAIVSHHTPTPHEICPVCKEIVQDAEIFACICGGDENEFPTIKCLTCLEWYHRPCINIFENEDQKFVCQRCTVQTTFDSRESDVLVDSQISQKLDFVRRKRALLIGINYTGNEELETLNRPQRDIKEVERLLKETFGFQDEDITILTDEVEVGASEAPTRDNIMQKVGEFIIPRQDNTDYVLVYSGHADQHPEPDRDEPLEEYGFMEFIVPVDAKYDNKGEYPPDCVIYDTYLHEKIIVTLDQTRGCHLFAIMDASHSASLLNLWHHRLYRLGTVSRALTRWNMYKQNTRPRVPNSSTKSTAICISACKDSELCFEHNVCNSLTLAIVELLKANPKANLKDAMYAARRAVDNMLETEKAETLDNPYLMSMLVRWNPQLSSNDPLDVNTTLMYRASEASPSWSASTPSKDPEEM